MAALVQNKNFAINGVSFYAKDIHYGWESLASEDSGRTLDGVMHIYWVKENLRKIEITLPPTTYQDISKIIKSVQGKDYMLTVWDPEIGDLNTFHCYTSNAKTDMYSGVIRNGLFENFEFHAIELGD